MKYNPENTPTGWYPFESAIRWFKNGDHPKDNCPVITYTAACERQYPECKEGDTFQGEGTVVRYYRNPYVSEKLICPMCNKTMHDHGWIEQYKFSHVVCPGDWRCECDDPHVFFPIKNSVFAALHNLPQDE